MKDKKKSSDYGFDRIGSVIGSVLNNARQTADEEKLVKVRCLCGTSMFVRESTKDEIHACKECRDDFDQRQREET